MNYDKIKKEIKTFVDERDWEQFHSPKNLSMALSVEASELVEIFQWQKQDEYKDKGDKVINAVKDEVADIFYYVVRMCQKMDINLEEALLEKMEKNKQKYPVEKVRGKSSLD
jgi:NTP pyrophosphatase (non-canonical NTP hydrolase)|tara:strand:- start:246 stop:581 length:336 start_codon:yes stop_codon:yes gene_type:complete